VSTYNGNDSAIKMKCREIAMKPLEGEKELVVFSILHPEKINGEWICKDMEVLRNNGAKVKMVIWCNNDGHNFRRITNYMDKYYSGKHQGILGDVNDSAQTIKNICNNCGPIDILYLDYCNLFLPEKQTLWGKLINYNLLSPKCKTSITLQVHGRNYSNCLWNNYNITLLMLMPVSSYRLDRHGVVREGGHQWSDPAITSFNWNYNLKNVFGSDYFKHYTKDGKFNKYQKFRSIPLGEDDSDKLYFKSIFVVSACMIAKIFQCKSNFSNGEAFIYDADGPNKMGFFSFVREVKNEVKPMDKTEFRKMVHEMSETMSNKEIAKELKVSISKVAGVMAWKNHRSSWGK
jgi:hypothetical protein